MDVREKLVELLREAPYNIFGNKLGNCYFDSCLALIADHLTANGVTVPEWISVDDRLPEDRGYYLVACRDKYNESTSIALDYYVICGAGEWWANEFTHNITHWMPPPAPPKGE